MSRLISFFHNVNLIFQKFGDRKYMGFNIVLKTHIIEVLKTMNEKLEFSGVNGDKTYVDTLLDRAFNSTELASKRPLDPNKLKFIKGRRGNSTHFGA